MSVDSFTCGRHKLKGSNANGGIFDIGTYGQQLLFSCLQAELFIFLRDDNVACSGHGGRERSVLLRVDVSVQPDLRCALAKEDIEDDCVGSRAMKLLRQNCMQ